MGWFRCEKIAPIPIPEASVSKTKDKAKSGKPKTGALHRAFFRSVKALSAVGVHMKGSLVNKVVSGATIVA